MIPLLLLAAGTLASEDLTCISAGLLVRRGQLHWSAAIGGCFLGIYVGDLGLWLMGRLLDRQVMRFEWLSRRLCRARLASLGKWFDEHTAVSVLAARFVPGTRLPIYAAAGALGRKGGSFALWTLLAALIWTPILVLLAASLGDAFAEAFMRFLGAGWLSLLAGVLGMVCLIRLATMLATEIGRAKLLAKIWRIWRWEFWPMWLFYLPLVPWIACLSIRWRGFMKITAANPGIPLGGFVGESKFQILSGLKGKCVNPTALIDPGDVELRLRSVAELNWGWPLIFKPDVGQRGAGVRLIKSLDEAREYLAANPFAIVIQPYHPGPFEAGIFYYRYPDQARGRIFSITDKRFPVLIGDGKASIEQLIWRHPRFRMQAKTFLARHRDQCNRVLAANEGFRLAIAGNHCQGTLFADGAALITDELERAIDLVAQSFPGFYFGRFDIRYGEVEQLKSGRNFAIIELNGVTSESTNIYDPSWSLWRAYQTLFWQWAILFRIGAMNQRKDRSRVSFTTLAKEVWRYYRQAGPPALAD